MFFRNWDRCQAGGASGDLRQCPPSHTHRLDAQRDYLSLKRGFHIHSIGSVAPRVWYSQAHEATDQLQI